MRGVPPREYWTVRHHGSVHGGRPATRRIRQGAHSTSFAGRHHQLRNGQPPLGRGEPVTGNRWRGPEMATVRPDSELPASAAWPLLPTQAQGAHRQATPRRTRHRDALFLEAIQAVIVPRQGCRPHGSHLPRPNQSTRTVRSPLGLGDHFPRPLTNQSVVCRAGASIR